MHTLAMYTQCTKDLAKLSTHAPSFTINMTRMLYVVARFVYHPTNFPLVRALHQNTIDKTCSHLAGDLGAA